MSTFAFVSPFALSHRSLLLPPPHVQNRRTLLPVALSSVRRVGTAHVTTVSSASPTKSTSASSETITHDALKHLQNGSDVRGVASDLIDSQPVNLTAAVVREIVASFVRRVASQLGKSPESLRISLGRDSRISGPDLLEAAAEGALSEGLSVTSFGLATTPAMFMSTVLDGYNFDCACMLTASHLPPNRNGIKFFTLSGSANKTDVKAILADAADAYQARGSIIPSDPSVKSRISTFDFLPVYARHLANLIRKGCAHPESYEEPLRGFKIVVDAGNGAAGFFANEVLANLGADVVGQFLEPDGMFPNHVPNPEDKKAMQMTIDTVKRHNADIGIVFDTDVDRSGVVDNNGLAINRNRLIALLARIVLRQYPNSTIVTDSVTSNGLSRFIRQNGGHHFRYRKGYKNVIDKGIELDKKGIQTELSIETSGHGALKENYNLDDGAYLVVKILIEMVRLHLQGDQRGITGLLDGLAEPREEIEFRLGFLDESDYSNYGAKVVADFAKFAGTVEGWTLESENHEGFRVRVDEGDGKEGWLLLRQSLHDPLLPMNVESEVDGGIKNIVKVLVEQFFSQYPNTDVSKLKEYVA